MQKGDTLRVSVAGFYPQPAPSSHFAFSLASFVASLLQPAPAGTPTRADGSRRGGLPLLQVGLNAAALPTIPQRANRVPKGYLRVLVFSQDSVLVDQRQFQLSQAAQGHYEVLGDTLTVRRDGYVTVYVGNESPVDVYFDELTVEHRQGLLVQETQYDPAGLELAGLAPPSPGIRGLNNYRWNGKEFQADLGLSWNHQDWRFFDPQLLRWHSGDPELENGQESWTPYSFGYDNAIRYADANGRWPDGGGALDFAAGIGTAFLDNVLPTGTRIVEMNSAGRDPNSYNAGLKVGNGLSLVFATIETATGLGVGGAGAVATAGSGGLALPVAAGGAALATHGAVTWGKAAYNLTHPRTSSSRTTDENGRVNASGKPYSDPTKRPKYGSDQVEKTWNAAKQPDGKVYDPHTGAELQWDKSKSRAGQWDMGHTKGQKYSELHKDYMDDKISKKEFLNRYRDPNNYKPESVSGNRSHKYE